MEEKLIKECPVCHSTNIWQDRECLAENLFFRGGSHCENCGTKFVFNSMNAEEFRKEEEFLRKEYLKIK